MTSEQATVAEEEYLQSLFWLQEAGLPMTGANLSRAMQLSAPTVHEMLGRLKDGHQNLEPTAGIISLAIGSLSEGFRWPAEGLVILTESELLGARHKRRQRRASKSAVDSSRPPVTSSKVVIRLAASSLGRTWAGASV